MQLGAEKDRSKYLGMQNMKAQIMVSHIQEFFKEFLTDQRNSSNKGDVPIM